MNLGVPIRTVAIRVRLPGDTMHRIHLKGPWEFQPLPHHSATLAVRPPIGGTIKFPAAWRDFLGDFAGCVRFTRHFNLPTNLEPQDRVDLVLDGLGGTAEILLNQVPVGSDQPPDQTGRFDITQLLRPHNILEISVEWDGTATGPGGLWAPVALEIFEG